MPTFIAKLPSPVPGLPDDLLYFVWGTVTDTPTSPLLTKEDLRQVYLARYDYVIDDEQWSAVEQKGSDCPWADDLHGLFAGNRYGEDEETLNDEEVVQKLAIKTLNYLDE